MILADARQRLSRDDAQFAARLLAWRTGEAPEALEQRLSHQGLDALLDDPRLPAALLELPQGARASLPLFAYVTIRHALLRAGEHDRGLADYVTAMVVDFGVGDRATRVGASDDELYTFLTDLARDLDDPDGRRSFLVRSHLGNYALWVSGLFPDHVEHRSWRRGGPDMGYYEEMGQRGFRLAADHRLAEAYGLRPLFEAAATRFAVLRAALNDVSDRLFFPGVHSPERLMRQVRDGMRWERA
jgi:hypothetical protein